MKALAQNALDAAVRRGISYADVRVVEEIDKDSKTKPDATIAIDMRRSLLEARRTVSQGEK